jgi:hypothetical protein
MLLFFLETNPGKTHNLIFFNFRPDYLSGYVYPVHYRRQKAIRKLNQQSNSPSIFSIGRQWRTRFHLAEHRPAAPGVSPFDGDAGQHFFKFLLGFGYIHLQ